jgi:hypothetical protein
LADVLKKARQEKKEREMEKENEVDLSNFDL